MQYSAKSRTVWRTAYLAESVMTFQAGEHATLLRNVWAQRLTHMLLTGRLTSSAWYLTCIWHQSLNHSAQLTTSDLHIYVGWRSSRDGHDDACLVEHHKHATLQFTHRRTRNTLNSSISFNITYTAYRLAVPSCATFFVDAVCPKKN